MVTGRERGSWYTQSSLRYQGSEWGPPKGHADGRRLLTAQAGIALRL